MSFIHLRLHTEYSLHDSILRISELEKADGHKSFALTDDNNLFGAVKFYNKLRKAGKKPIIGSEVTVETPYGIDTLVLLSKNRDSYKRIMHLLTSGYQSREDKNDNVVIKWDDFLNLSRGNFVLSGGNGSLLFSLLNAKDKNALNYASDLKRAFGDDYFFELHRLGQDGENNYIDAAIDLASNLDIPVVATNNVRFLSKQDFQTHEVREAISNSSTLQYMRQHTNNYSPEQYLKTPEQMEELFSDIPSAISNTEYIAKSCNTDIELGKDYLPDFPVPKGEDASSYLVKVSKEGLEERLMFLYPDEVKRQEVRWEYDERLEMELGVINRMGFPGYFLIVMEFVQWCKDNNVPVGPGRGSGAGSLVAYSLKITDLDPLEFDLLFERFLNPERISMPDFDIDFCMAGRDKVIRHVAEKYGSEAVSQIVTFGTMAAKMVIKDVARVLGHPYMFGDQLSKLIPARPGIKLQEAINEVPALKMRIEDDPQVAEVIEHSLRLEGLTRQVGKHAGGVLISPTTIPDFSPIYRESIDTPPVSQFDKNDVEAVGLVKFDFLGLRTLTIEQHAIDLINKKKDPNLTIYNMPRDDKYIYKLISDANTVGVFQLESAGMRNLITRLEPQSFEEIIALVALYRPGPLDSGMVDTYINCKKGIEEIKYPHPLLEDVLDVTYGVFVYQEQVMKAAQVMAKYTLGQADLLRKAMGKKLPEEMVKQRKMFVEGSVNNGIDREQAGKVFDLMETFAGYGFNKSHSAAYALVSINTAYLKYHYPSEFFAAVLTADSDFEDKVVRYMHNAKTNGVTILPPCINTSDGKFTVDENERVLFGLKAIKGVGGAIQEKIINERNENGKFHNIFDFLARTRPTKTVFAALIYSGAFDSFGMQRGYLHRLYEPTLMLFNKFKEQAKKDPANAKSYKDSYEHAWINLVENQFNGQLGPVITESELIIEERKRLGFYLSNHPCNGYKQEANAVKAVSIEELNSMDGTQIMENKKRGGNGNAPVVVGAVTDIVVRNNKKSHSAKVTIDDGTGKVDLNLKGKLYNAVYHLLEKDAVLSFRVGLSYNPQSERIYRKVYECEDIDMVRQRLTKQVCINIDLDNPVKKDKLKDYLNTMRKGAYKVVVKNTSDPDGKLLPIGQGRMLNDKVVAEINSLCEQDDAVEFTFHDPDNVKSNGIKSNEVDEELVQEELLRLDNAFKHAQAVMGVGI